MTKIDFFICHASEDKEKFVRELAQQLIRNGASVFYDEYSIKLGDSLTQKINEGLQNANYGIVVLSNFFFEKKWTNAELQSIFNKSVNDGFKLLIIYHNVDNDYVRNKFPLLADIKATTSEKGFEKVADELFEAAGMVQQLGYMTIPFTEGQGINKEDGFHILIRFSLPQKGESRFPKVLFESGVPNQQNSRVRLVIKWNKRLYFEIVSNDFQTIGLSCDIENWKLNEPHIVIANFDSKNKIAYLLIDGCRIDEFQFEKFNLPDKIFESGRGIVGCSLELENPAPFQISGLSFGKSLTFDESTKLFEITDKFNKDLGR
jgi:hypothetical protein